MQHAFRSIAAFALILFAVLAPSPSHAAGYASTVSAYNALVNDPDRAGLRDSWTQLARRFGEISRQGGKNAAEAAFMEARSLGELARRSLAKSDFAKAGAAYASVAERFPESAKAPEALHRHALIFMNNLRQKQNAAPVLDALIARYPEYARRERIAALRARTGVAPSASRQLPQTSEASATPGKSGAAAKPNPAAAAKAYAFAAGEWRDLLKDASKNTQRPAWIKLERRFLDALALDPTGETGCKALFQAARCMEELATHSRSKGDWQAAVAHFDMLASSFPKNGLADDGLYRAASIRAKHLNDPDTACRDAERILNEYARGDMVRNAKTLLAELPPRKAASGSGDAGQASGSSKPSGKDAANAGSLQNAASARDALPSQAGSLVNMTVKGSTRRATAVLELDGAAVYRHQYLAPTEDGLPPRLQIDIDGVAPGKSLKKLLTQDKLAIPRMQAIPMGGKTPSIRVILDLKNVRQYIVDTSVSPPGISVRCSTRTDIAGGATPARDKNGPVVQARFSGVSRNKPGTLLEQLGLAVRTVMIDAGHGGKDPGALGAGTRESDITLRLALLLGERLKKQGFSVLYTRNKDVYVALDERAVIANDKKADLFISLHVNASKDKAINGLETYFLDLARSNSAATVAARENAVSVKGVSDLQFILTDLMLTSKLQESHDLAKLLHQKMHGRVRQAGFTVNDNGVRSAPFYVLMGARMPAALVEIGYLTNEDDARRIVSPKYLERLADGLAAGVAAYKEKLSKFAR